MGAAYEQAVATDAAFHMSTYARKPVMFVRGAGMKLYDDEGKEYLDFVSGLGAVNLGHAHPAVASAVAVQAATLVHVSNLYHVQHRAELAAKLAGLLGGEYRSFFCNSGAEASEGAIKLARRWGREAKGKDCYRIVTAERSFHGRTLGALAATGQPSKQEAFAPLPEGFIHVPINDIDALEAVVDDSVCAVMLEPVQGEGGVHPCTEEYLRSVRTLCDEKDVLLVLDEVQTGFYRTGSAFAFQGYGVIPDVVTLAKAIANGLPMGAIAAGTKAGDVLRPGDHGSTFGGGPVVCAAALATMDALAKENVGENARTMGAYLADGLRELGDQTGTIAEVRGRGLMMAAQLTGPHAPAVVAGALDKGIVLNNIGDSTLRFLPPLVCSETEMDILLSILHEALRTGVQ